MNERVRHVCESMSIAELMPLLASTHYLNRSQAARVLVRHREQSEIVWPALLVLRGDECAMVRMQIPRAAVHLGIPPAEAIPVLHAMLGDWDEIVQGYAAWGLERFGQGTKADILADLDRQGLRATGSFDSWVGRAKSP